MTDDDPEEQGATPAQLMARAKATHGQLQIARAAMLKEKNVEAALGFCHAQTNLRGARAALPPLRLVSSR